MTPQRNTSTDRAAKSGAGRTVRKGETATSKGAATKKPSAAKPSAAKPSATNPSATKQPATKQPATEQPATKRSAKKESGKRESGKRETGAGRTGSAPGAPRTAEQIGSTSRGPRPVPELTGASATVHPDLVTSVLDNGLRVIAVRKPGTPLVEVRLRVPFGGASASHTARAELLSATLLLGTSTRTREQVDAELAMVGGHLDASVDPVRLAVTGSVLSTGLPVLLDVLAESLTEPAFARHDVLGERSRLAEHLAIAASQPSVVARRHLQAVRFGTHPVTREMPDADAVAAVGVAALRSLQQRALVPTGSTLVVVGDVEPEAAISAAAAALGRWAATGKARAISTPPAVGGGPVHAFHRAGAVQSQVRLSADALLRTDPDYAAGQLANLVYGGYFSSRLVENIREAKGYTYSAQSNFEFWPGRAAVTVSFDTTTPSTAAALLEARYELGRLALTPPEAKEVESARNYALGTLATSLSTQAGYASTLSSLAGLGLDADWVWEHPARLAAVTVADVARVAAALLAPTAFTGVVVGDLDAIGRVAVGDRRGCSGDRGRLADRRAADLAGVLRWHPRLPDQHAGAVQRIGGPLRGSARCRPDAVLLAVGPGADGGRGRPERGAGRRRRC